MNDCEKKMLDIYTTAVAECTPRVVPAECVDFHVDDGLDRFNEIQLRSHNAFRSGHQDTPDMTYNVDLAFQAYEYACHLATVEKRLVHSANDDRPNQGENLYWQWSTQDINLVADNDNAAQSWYSEIEDYNFTSPDESTGVIGHFTQMVWKGTEQLGCGYAGD